MMDNQPGLYRFPARRCGEIAYALFRHGTEGRVSAVFNNSFYLESAGHYACIGNLALPAGPLNVAIEAPGNMDWRAAGLRNHAAWRVSVDTLYLGDRFAIPFGETEIWRPPPIPADWRAGDLRRGRAECLRRAAHRTPVAGLARLVIRAPRRPPDPVMEKIAAAPVADLRAWLASAFRDPHAAPCPPSDGIGRLVGMGPGLTPSGDDFLAGVLIALSGFGAPAKRQRLWDAVQPLARDAGNPISMAHLAAAARGLGGAALHDLLAALVRADAAAIAAGIDALDGIGHTSGWDALAGLMACVEARLDAFECTPETTE